MFTYQTWGISNCEINQTYALALQHPQSNTIFNKQTNKQTNKQICPPSQRDQVVLSQPNQLQ